MPVRRSKQMTVDMYSRQHDVIYIFMGRHFPSVQMIIRMIANAMLFNKYLLIDIRMLDDTMTDTEKSSMRMIIPELLEHKWCDFRMRAIIECEVNSRIDILFFPYKSGKQCFHPSWCACPVIHDWSIDLFQRKY